jgi:hypothetical protein
LIEIKELDLNGNPVPAFMETQFMEYMLEQTYSEWIRMLYEKID